jgi:hypothetical protein
MAHSANKAAAQASMSYNLTSEEAASVVLRTIESKQTPGVKVWKITGLPARFGHSEAVFNPDLARRHSKTGELLRDKDGKVKYYDYAQLGRKKEYKMLKQQFVQYMEDNGFDPNKEVQEAARQLALSMEFTVHEGSNGDFMSCVVRHRVGVVANGLSEL